MKQLYAPWRSGYAGNENSDSKHENTPKNQCIFCKIYKDTNNTKHLILKKFDHSYVMMNKYPYNAGHLLVIPNRHEGSLNKLSPQERAELIEVTSLCTEILNKTLKNEGTNIGINLGKVAGAGIPAHLHIHVLPRWNGDTNFMPAIAETKVISFDMEKIYQQLKEAFNTIEKPHK